MKAIDLHLLNAEHDFKRAINHAFDLGWDANQERIIKDVEEAYPADVFPEPDWEQVRDALATIGVTLDAVAGSLLRRQIPAFIKGEGND